MSHHQDEISHESEANLALTTDTKEKPDIHDCSAQKPFLYSTPTRTRDDSERYTVEEKKESEI